MTDWATIAALATIGGFGIAFATFWLRFGGRVSKAEGDAKAAKALADDAVKKIELMAASFSLYREQVARDYIHREVMREVEDRLTAAINRLGDRFDALIQNTMHNKTP